MTHIPCGVHPLHFVKVQANGSRTGCSMCEMQIEDLCRPKPSTSHAPRMAFDPPRIISCTCGWRTPPGEQNSDDAYVLHLALHVAVVQ